MAAARRYAHAGVTLIELALMVAILAIVTGLALPAFGGARDRLAVRRAADAVVMAVARTRAVAVARGGASLVIHVPAATLRTVVAGGETPWPALDLGHRFGVAVEAAGRERLRIRFDALGIGRMANRTLRITRGEAESNVAISAYGRVRQW